MLFKEWLLLEEGGSNLQRYNKGGMVNLYHYSPYLTADKVVLDPGNFGKNKYTQAEKRAASTPRLFFYVDLRDKEGFFAQNQSVYKTVVPIKQIYDLEADPRKAQERGTPDIGYIFSLAVEDGETGAYYRTGDMQVVAWFNKIKAKRFSEKEILRNDFGVNWDDIKKEKADALSKRQQEDEIRRKKEEEEFKIQQAERDVWWQQELAQQAAQRNKKSA